MKKKLLLVSILVLAAFPFSALALTDQECVAQYGTGWTVVDGLCRNTAGSSSSTQPPVVVTNNQGTGGNGAVQTGTPGNTPAFCNKGVCTYIPLEPLPGGEVAQSGAASFASLLAAAFKLLVTLGSLFAVVMIVISGIGYMLSETPLAMEKAKDRAWAAFKGLLLLGAAWLIIYTINPKLLSFNLLTNDLQQSTQRAGIPGAPVTTQPVTTVTPNGISDTKIYNGSDAYAQLITSQNGCRGTFTSNNRGTDSGGEYTVWRCQ